MKPYVLALKRSEDLAREFGKIGVDPGGIGIMRAKAFLRCVKIHHLPSFWANILKQEMLSLGGDAALSRGAITGKVKTTDCLLMGNLAQLIQLAAKLKRQPFGLSGIGSEIKSVVENFENRAVLDLAGRKLRMGKKTLLMGIINVTPDSFSGDGIARMEPHRQLLFARDMVNNGADILDIGGESTRPGSRKISTKEELARVLPVLKQLSKNIRVPISIDTTKSEVAHAALDSGASIVNDISSLRFDKKMAKIVARTKACLVLMHMKGTPAGMQKNPEYGDLMAEIIAFLLQRMNVALDAGICRDKIILDPGIGFGKTVEHNLEILDGISSLKSLGRPILAGVSRKWFIGKILGTDIRSRTVGTAAAMSIAIANGADIVRVHDVCEMKQAALLADAICRRSDQRKN